MFFAAIRSLFRKRPARRLSRLTRVVRPRLESIEDRLVPATFSVNNLRQPRRRRRLRQQQ